jgi:hypothetical protein
MSKDKARQAVLSEYDSWVKKHPDDARMMGGFLFFRYLQTDKSDLLDSVRLAASGQSFTAGFKIGCKISLSGVRLFRLLIALNADRFCRGFQTAT